MIGDAPKIPPKRRVTFTLQGPVVKAPHKGTTVLVVFTNGEFLTCEHCARRIFSLVKIHARKSDDVIKRYYLECNCGHSLTVKGKSVRKFLWV